ncbi:uncharacterized protein LAESUDRAFT_431014 [Laetiporus sulphureus 93-53]|uniref:Uncharacterized protein n=1 Tax=Laetiporus sulphureus 93-53 TaxID=1314785 RepID=A0A165C4R4_9APHY|nr:uncharacterized protein LAESUDRAFT_431014 [Laetiporus sulphureus 93-53]KZT02201.1 hypothetical protein LAESUDRAFT_431014 [Laetiporus sulphureus 93-53]
MLVVACLVWASSKYGLCRVLICLFTGAVFVMAVVDDFERHLQRTQRRHSCNIALGRSLALCTNSCVTYRNVSCTSRYVNEEQRPKSIIGILLPKGHRCPNVRLLWNQRVVGETHYEDAVAFVSDLRTSNGFCKIPQMLWQVQAAYSVFCVPVISFPSLSQSRSVLTSRTPV